MPDENTPLEFPDGFGVDSEADNMTGRTTNNSVQTAYADNKFGTHVKQATYGLVTEITEDSFQVGEFENEAVEGQSGDEVTTGHNLTESNTAFATVQKTLSRIPGGGFKTTTTTTTE